MFKQLSILAVAAFVAAGLSAEAVKLTDGSTITGTVTQLDNGDVKVVNAAGETVIAKDKVSAVVTDSSASSAPTEGNGTTKYIEDVKERRAAYGNEDGIPRSVNLQKTQLLLTLGQLNYTGDAFTPTSSELAGISYGLAWAHSFTDHVALETWGDYSYAYKELPGVKLKVQRFNVGLGPKVQFATRIGRVESGMVLIPNFGLSAVWSSAEIDANGTYNSGSVGGSANAGLDFQFGGAVVGLKARYLLTNDVTRSGANKNTSAFMPQLGVGFSF
jgi:hypothetical protein